ncbi:hypothetical protein O998_01090 [Anaplasma phagocytophilum str. Norway variant1]|uniref:Uncharacterized protein n=1 Tax=Anaplasma phagocytophilum str. Norway variant1 TaxID=1392506 RepID=A0A7H9DYA1_ANAPH|nr:hypothetical protein [Anaplasma phagocytophilum]QLL66480.1 hypothetical protein O998_01090 [Anaplasma phagocytophilum str. Norway variant1]
MGFSHEKTNCAEKGKSKTRTVRVYSAKKDKTFRLDEETYDLRNRIYVCYILCTSVLCILPVLPYYVSKELYKRGYRRGAAISMELFLYSHCLLSFTLVVTQIVLFLLKGHPRLLDGFFVHNKDLAVLLLAVMCALPAFLLVVIVRYARICDIVKSTGCSLVDALLKRSYLTDITHGVPVLLCYTGDYGPLFTHESVKDRRDCGADLVLDIYLYSTSYLLMLPACFGLLCDFFLQQKKRSALSVCRVLGVTAHVLLINTVVIAAITFLLGKFSINIALIKLCADATSTALLNGVLFSAVIMVIAGIFCCYEISNNTYACSTEEVPDGVARSVLKFGLPTIGLYFVCDLFRIRATRKNRGCEYNKYDFVVDVVHRIMQAFLLLPVPFLYIANNMQGRRRVAAVLQRTGIYLEVFLENFILFSLFFYGILQIPAVANFFPSTLCIPLGCVTSILVLVIAAVCDLYHTRKVCRSQGEKAEDVVLNNEFLKDQLSNFSIFNFVASCVISLIFKEDARSSCKVYDNVEEDVGTFLEMSMLECMEGRNDNLNTVTKAAA